MNVWINKVTGDALKKIEQSYGNSYIQMALLLLNRRF